uniref:Mitochondrial fission regulator n=1 Tax=Pogona vitticeps TaxID=103695 RepID=A0A6J0SJE5_9SAUR
MSLLLNLLRQLLEYYGVAPELLLQRCEVCLNRIAYMIGSHLSSNSFSRMHFQELCAISRRCLVSWAWERKKYGSTRSFVRRLGKCLSLTPCPRPHLQLVQSLNYLESGQASTLSAVTPSLADVLWVPNDDREAYAKFRFVEWRNIVTPAVPVPTASTENLPVTPVVDEDAFKKLSALENELVHLRRQIASIVAVRRAEDNLSCSNIVSSTNTPSSVLQWATVTSTPVPVSPRSVLAPPPPPPPPAVLLSNFDSCNSKTELKEHQVPNKKRNITNSSRRQEAKAVPCMMDVLKDINKVKLRAIERSPGGTPLPKTKKVMQSQWDPATLIAEALKEKFASHLSDDSFDKENRSYDASPFSSPDTPMVHSHILKPGMKQTLHRTEKPMSTTATKTRVQI